MRESKGDVIVEIKINVTRFELRPFNWDNDKSFPLIAESGTIKVYIKKIRQQFEDIRAQTLKLARGLSSGPMWKDGLICEGFGLILLG